MIRNIEAEVVIVGSGAGGSTMAATLAEHGLDVLILEEGPWHTSKDVPNTAANSMLQLWRSAGLTPAMGRIPVAYAEGRCVGGGTEINSAIFQEAPPEILGQWAKAIPDFEYDCLVPHYKWAAEAVNASETQEELGEPSRIIKRAGSKMGWRTDSLPRGQKSCVGTNLCSFGCPTGGKQSMSTTLIPSALKSGAKVIANTRVKKLHVANGRVHGLSAVQTDDDGNKKRLRVKANDVFVACGTIHSAALLQRSGLKSRSSSSFQLHPTAKVLAVFDEQVDAFNSRLPLYAITEFLPNYRMGGSVTTPGTFGVALAEDWQNRHSLNQKHMNCASYYSMVRPRGWGSITSLPGLKTPFVSYELDRMDYETIKRSLSQLCEALFAVGAKIIYPSISNHRGWRSPEIMKTELSEFSKWKSLNLMSIHLFSSASPVTAGAENDSFGKLAAAENVFVIDGSLVPSAPCVNPQATIMALARRSGLKFLAER